MTKPSEFHVGIENPAIVRRELLETTRSVIHILQKYEKFSILRKEKKEYTLKLQQLMREIKELNIKLKAVFPNVPLPKEHGKNKKTLPPKISAANNDLDKLEAELSHIESKLSLMK